jgi:hypothetical protein
MTEPPPPKRQKKQKKKDGPLREDDPFFTADAMTIERFTTMDSSGRTITKEVTVPVFVLKEQQKKESTPVSVQEDQTDCAGGPYDNVDDEEYGRPTGTRMVRLCINTGNII